MKIINVSATMMAALLAALGASGCSDGAPAAKTTGLADSVTMSFDMPAVPRDQVERFVLGKFAEITGVRPKRVVCPDDLPTRAGGNMRCVTVWNDDSTLGVTVTTTAGSRPGQVGVSFKADSEATPAPTP